jgi:hypothetical protein
LSLQHLTTHCAAAAAAGVLATFASMGSRMIAGYQSTAAGKQLLQARLLFGAYGPCFQLSSL